MIASLRLRILVVVAIALLLATLIGGFQARQSAQELAQNLQDQNLRAMAFGFFSSVTASQGSWVTPEELSDFIPPDVDQYFYRLIGPKGSYISGYNFVQVPVPDNVESGVAYFATWTDASGATYRGVSISAFVDQFEAPGWVTLQVAQSTRGAQGLVAEQMQSYFLTAALICIGALISAVIILSTIFRPLSLLTQSVARRSPEDLSSIQQPVPVEVRPLKERLNSLFELVRNEQDAKDRLISNVAHQLRTPLTTIRVRTDLALNANDPQVHLEALDREAERAGVLASQLMSLESDGGAVELVELDLAALLSSLLEDWSMTFVKAGVKLKFEVAEGAEGGMIIGSSLLIEEVLSNLLDNTLQHANAKSVTVAVNGSVMEVWDDGTGVDERSLGWVFERFYKASEGAEAGYGLGLSIVREFATRMGAKVRAENRNGLWVAVAFRVAETGVSAAH
ncbi:MAG: sensor histidine kinase [Alphaproteobacteria bacterium]